MPDEPRHLGELLRSLRGDRDVDEVAAALKVNRSTVYLWESSTENRRRPEPEHLQPLLKLYGATDAQQLLAWELRAVARDVPSQEASHEPTLDPHGVVVVPAEVAEAVGLVVNGEPLSNGSSTSPLTVPDFATPDL